MPGLIPASTRDTLRDLRPLFEGAVLEHGEIFCHLAEGNSDYLKHAGFLALQMHLQDRGEDAARCSHVVPGSLDLIAYYTRPSLLVAREHVDDFVAEDPDYRGEYTADIRRSNPGLHAALSRFVELSKVAVGCLAGLPPAYRGLFPDAVEDPKLEGVPAARRAPGFFFDREYWEANRWVLTLHRFAWLAQRNGLASPLVTKPRLYEVRADTLLPANEDALKRELAMWRWVERNAIASPRDRSYPDVMISSLPSDLFRCSLHAIDLILDLDLTRPVAAAIPAGSSAAPPASQEGVGPHPAATERDESGDCPLPSGDGASPSPMTAVRSVPPPHPRRAGSGTAPLSGKERTRLSKIKQEVNPRGRYIGSSLTMLRLYERIWQLNKDPSLPLLIRGGPGVGKTELAGLIHECSDRRGCKFERVQAADFMNSDTAFVITKLVGYGRHSGVNGIPPAGTEGLIQACRGGTLFIDEVARIPRERHSILNDLLDGKPIARAAGTGDPVTPDVRLILATYEDLEAHVAAGTFAPDLWSRLRQRVIEVPPLANRREDIPLFVERFVDGHPFDHRFLYALLIHQWPDDVRGLKGALQAAVSRTERRSERLTLDHLELNDDGVVRLVRGLDADAAERECYEILVQDLERLGHRKGKGLQQEIAKFLGVSESTVTRRMRDFGIDTRGPEGGPDPGS
jgi:DNA-binding NtrC family response regulator